jgi:hypothetical protein
MSRPLTRTFESGCRDLNPGPLDPQASVAPVVESGLVGFSLVVLCTRGAVDGVVGPRWAPVGQVMLTYPLTSRSSSATPG